MNESEVIREVLQHVNLVQIDCEKGEGPEIAKTYGVRGYPTFVAVDADGEITDRTIGYEGSEAWADFAGHCAADRRTLAAKAAAYAEAPTAALARSLADDASASYDFKSAVDFFRAARKLDPDDADAYTESILTNMYYGSFEDEFSLDEVEAEVKPVFSAPRTETADKVRLAAMITDLARGAGEPERAAPYLRDAMAASEGAQDEELAGQRAHLAVDAALIVDHDPARAVELERGLLPEGWREDARQLNRFAWWCFENRVNLDEALALALKGVELAPDDRSRAQILDTVAEISNALGDCAGAVAHMERAVELQPEVQSYQDQLSRFEKIRAEGDCG